MVSERITDTSFKILGEEVKKYHLECQSSTDNSMAVRFFEYDTQSALEELKGNVLTVTFPHSAVLFLRCTAATPSRLKIRMVTPGGTAEYGIQVMKAQQYTINEIFEKGLLLLIPFYIFSHEKQFVEYEKDETKLKALQKEYEQIKNKLEDLLNQGAISEYTRCTIIDMSNKVLEHIAVKYHSVKEGVKSVMGGRVLEYEAKAIREEGIEKGIEKGMEKGMEKGIAEGIKGTVSILKKLDISPQTIMPDRGYRQRLRECRGHGAIGLLSPGRRL